MIDTGVTIALLRVGRHIAHPCELHFCSGVGVRCGPSRTRGLRPTVSWPHRDDAIAETLQAARNAKTGARLVRRQTDHGDAVYPVQQLADLFRFGIGESHVSLI